MTERMKNSLINMSIQLIANIVIPFIGFFRIRLLVLNYGSDMNGVVQIFTQLMSFLQLTQMGFGTSFIVSLYKPLADNDIKKVNEIYNANSYFQKRVALIMFLLSCCSFLYLPFFIQESVIPLYEAVILFVCFSLPYIVYQLCNAKLMVIRAMQQEYIFYRVSESMSCIRLLLSLILIQSVDFFTYLILDSLLFVLAYSMGFLAVHKKIKPMVSITKDKDKSPVKTAKYVVFQNITTMVTQNTDNLVISHFLVQGTALVSVYNSYMYVVNTIDTVCSTMVMSMVGSFGNLLASGEEYVNYTFKQILVVVGCIASIICTSVFFGTTDFVLIWMDGADRSYDLGVLTSFLLALLLFYRITKLPFELVLSSKNLFKITTPGFILTSIVNLTLSIFLVQKIGIIGALFGTVVAYYMCDFMSKAICVVKYGLGGNMISFIKIYGVIFSCFLLNVGGLHFFYQYNAETISIFLWKMIQTTSISCIIFIMIYSCLFYEFRDVVKIVINLMKGFLNKVVKRYEK